MDTPSTVGLNSIVSLGDINEDGFDEQFAINDGSLYCYNSNYTLCEGFPLSGLFSEIPLIVDLLDGDGPEIIVKNGDYISIISND